MTRLDKPLRREVLIEDDAYTLTIDPEGLKLVPKGKRNGVTLKWARTRFLHSGWWQRESRQTQDQGQ